MNSSSPATPRPNSASVNLSSHRAKAPGTLEAVQVLAAAEWAVMETPGRVPWAPVQRGLDLIFGVFSFVYSGATVLFRQVMTTLVLWAGIYWLLAKLRPIMETGPGESVGYFALLLAVSIVVFSIPSLTAVRGVKPANVTRVCSIVLEVAPSPDALERLREGVEVVKASASERVVRIGWALGLAWAGLSWFIVRYGLGEGIPETLRKDSFQAAFIWLVVYAIAAFFYVGFAISVRVLHQTLDFAFLDAQAGIEAARASALEAT